MLSFWLMIGRYCYFRYHLGDSFAINVARCVAIHLAPEPIPPSLDTTKQTGVGSGCRMQSEPQAKQMMEIPPISVHVAQVITLE